MTMTTRWHPDTCNCELHYDVIDEVSGDPIWVQEKCCERHQTADECLADNRAVNSMVNDINNTFPPEEHVQKVFDVKTNTLSLVSPKTGEVVETAMMSYAPRLASKVVN